MELNSRARITRIRFCRVRTADRLSRGASNGPRCGPYTNRARLFRAFFTLVSRSSGFSRHACMPSLFPAPRFQSIAERSGAPPGEPCTLLDLHCSLLS